MDQWIILISVAYLSRLNYSYLPVLVTLSLSLLPFHGGNDENMRESQVGENIQIFANSFYRTGRKRINKEEMQCWHFLLLLSMTRAHYITTKDQGQHFLLFSLSQHRCNSFNGSQLLHQMQQKSTHTTNTTEQKLQNSRCNSIMLL